MRRIYFFKTITLFSLFLLVTSAFADGVKLCEPLSTSKYKDEIGGYYSSSLDNYIEALDNAALDEGWLTIKESSERKLKNKCTRIALKPTSTLFLRRNIFGHQPADFLNALAVEKRHIIEFYKSESLEDERIVISDDEYNRLAFLAAGIMGAESSAGKSVYYLVEHSLSKLGILENLAVCVSKRTWKSCTSAPITSRGMTQIKKVPLLGELYGIDRDNLSDPYKSGVATMGFLIETYRWYLGIIHNQKRYYISPGSDAEEDKRVMRREDFEVFLTYMYRGATNEIYEGTASPDRSCYYKRVQKFQEYLRFYIVPDQDCSEAGASILD